MLAIQRAARWLLSGLVLIAGSSSCDRPGVSAADLLTNVEPFNALEGVALGTKAGDLVERRPAVNPAPYVGYKEKIGLYEILYHFPGVEWNEAQVPPAGRKRIRIIEASKPLRNDTAASQAWTEQFAAASRTLRAQPRCYRIPAGRQTGRATSTDRIAMWDLEGQVFEIFSVGKRLTRSSAALPESSSRIVLTLSRKANLAENVLQWLTGRKEVNSGRIAEPCPSG